MTKKRIPLNSRHWVGCVIHSTSRCWFMHVTSSSWLLFYYVENSDSIYEGPLSAKHMYIHSITFFQPARHSFGGQFNVYVKMSHTVRKKEVVLFSFRPPLVLFWVIFHSMYDFPERCSTNYWFNGSNDLVSTLLICSHPFNLDVQNNKVSCRKE